MKWVYGAIGAFSIFSYVTMRGYLIKTPLKDIVVSNLTANMVFFMMVLGGVVYYVAQKLVFNKTKNKSMKMAYSVGLTAISVWLIFMAVMGQGIK